MFNSILIVCVGNICRSPMGEYLFKVRLKDRGKTEIAVASAGIGALVDRPADPNTVTLLNQAGIDCGEHRAQQLTQELITEFDLILVMEQGHIDDICRRHSFARGKVHLLGKWLDNLEIDDPYKKDMARFEKAYQLVERSCDSWIEKLF